MHAHANRVLNTSADWQNIFRTLDDLCSQCRSALGDSRVINRADAQKLLDYVANVRKLLTELNQIEGRAKGDERRVAAIQDLRQRYGELDHMVKKAATGLENGHLA